MFFLPRLPLSSSSSLQELCSSSPPGLCPECSSCLEHPLILLAVLLFFPSRLACLPLGTSGFTPDVPHLRSLHRLPRQGWGLSALRFSLYALALLPDSASLVAQTVKNLPAMQETRVRSLGQEDPLEKGMATHSSVLAWRIPWTEEPARIQAMGSQRVRHD